MGLSVACVACVLDWYVCLSVCYASVSPTVYICLFLFVCLFVCLSVCLSVCLFVCLFVCLSVCVSLGLSTLGQNGSRFDRDPADRDSERPHCTLKTIPPPHFAIM